MNNSETPTGVNGRKELQVKEGNIEDLLSNYFEIEKDEPTGFKFIVFDVPRDKAEKEIQNVDANVTDLIKEPSLHMVASKLPSRNEKNAKAYDKERAKASEQSKIRREKNSEIAENEER